MKQKRIFFYLVAIIGLTAAVLLIKHDIQPTSDISLENDISEDKGGQIATASSKNPEEHNPTPENNQEKVIWRALGDEASAAKVRSWFAAKGTYGFYGPEYQDDYKNYDLETLTKLSESGDIHAMLILSERIMDIEKSKELLDRAAIYGSTEALAQIAIINEVKNKIHQKTPEEQKPIILETLAYYEAAQMRGDWWVKIQSGDSLLTRYPTTLTQQDEEFIKQRGKQIYDDLQKQRTELGLGDFDNSVPDEVMKFYEEMLRPL